MTGGRFVFALVVGLVAVGPLSTDLYLPSLPSIARALDASVAQAQLTLSAYMTAFAFVQLAYGPLSDRFGRKPVAIGGMAVYAAAVRSTEGLLEKGLPPGKMLAAAPADNLEKVAVPIDGPLLGARK